MQNILEYLLELIYRLPIVLITITVHEVAHGYAAYKLGDPTAKSLGRLTLNPLKHIDIFGALCMLIFKFGWAKPVPINTRYFKKPKRDMAITALAGPLANFAMAFVLSLIYVLLTTLLFCFPFQSELAVSIVTQAALYILQFSFLNISLGIFNLIPCPPLDGSRIFLVWLPMKVYFGIMKYERFMPLVLMLLLYTGILTPYLSGISMWLQNLFISLFDLIPGLLTIHV